MKRGLVYELQLTVFISGACVLALEIVALRILEPYFGTTLYSLSSVLSVVLFALSVGYAIGGRLADRNPSRTQFYQILTYAGYAVFLLVVLRQYILPTLGNILPISYGPLICSLLLFFVPNLLLGILSPYAIQLEVLQKKQQSGRIAGDLFFWSTIGSIAGSLLTGFLLVPNLGLYSVLLGIGFMLCVVGIVPRLSSIRRELLIPFFLITIFIATSPTVDPGVIYAREGMYQSIQVRDTTYQNHSARFLTLGGSVESGQLLDSEEQAFDYTKYFALYRVLKPETKLVLAIGAGAYTIPKAFVAELPEVQVDTADIEPLLLPIAQNYFGLTDTSRIHTHLVDGRRMLMNAKSPYDFIYSDVYHTIYSIPPHLTTLEFYTQAHAALAADGVFMANITGSLLQDKQSFLFSEMRTFREAFQNSYFIGVTSTTSPGFQNVIFIGMASDKQVDWNSDAITKNPDPIIREAPQHLIDTSTYNLENYPILTDDYAPVEYLIAKLFSTSVPAKDIFF